MGDAKTPPDNPTGHQPLRGGITTQVVDGFRLAASQQTFNAWADTKGTWSHRISIAMGALLLAAILLFDVYMAINVAHDGPLLWWGQPGTAVLSSVDRITQGRSRVGPKFTLRVSYAFTVPGGSRFTGEAMRRDLSNPPSWKPGERIDIRYLPSNPNVSTIDYHLSSDVYAGLILAIFLLVVPGGLMLVMFWRYWRRPRD